MRGRKPLPHGRGSDWGFTLIHFYTVRRYGAGRSTSASEVLYPAAEVTNQVRAVTRAGPLSELQKELITVI